MDRSYFRNPVTDYYRWLKMKISYQKKYKHIRIGYKNTLHNVRFGKYNWTSERVVMENVTIGDFSYVSDDSVILEATIGKFCSIGPNVRIAPGNHPTHTFVSTHPSLFSNPSYAVMNFFNTDYYHPDRHVTVGNDVWIGANVVISDGITIGDGAIIAANAVVTSNVEPYCMVGGVPAKAIRYRFNPDEIEFLLKIKWWDKSIEWIKQHASYFLSIEEFVKLLDRY